MAEDKKKSKVSIAVDPSKSMSTISQKSTSRMQVRRQSLGFSRISGITPVKSSTIGLEFKRPALIYLNTYQLDPVVKFDPIQVTKVTEALLDDLFTNHVYNRQLSPELALRVANEVTRTVKDMNFNRYRILCIVTLAQDRAQSYSNAITFLWDHERDNYVDVQREIRTAFIQVTVFGIYLD